MIRKTFPMLLVSALISLAALSGFAYTTAPETPAPEAAADLPLELGLNAMDLLELEEALVCDENTFRTSLTEECVDCLVACMATGQSGTYCRMNDCMWPCND